MHSATRAEKEAFVEGLDGSTIWQCLVPTLVVPAALLAEANLSAVLELRREGVRSSEALPTATNCVDERSAGGVGARGAHSPPPTLSGVLLVGVLLLTLTVPVGSWIPTVLLLVLLAASGGCHYLARRDLALRAAWRLAKANNLFYARRNFITALRGSVMLMTCVCILAVDFPCFPREYGKTETFGTGARETQALGDGLGHQPVHSNVLTSCTPCSPGLMDLGVGLFVVSSALTSRWARAHGTASQGASPPDMESAGSGAIGVLVTIAPLLLGALRLAVLKLLNYQEHVSEYGTHWNFFLSLACVHGLAAGAHRCLPTSMVMPMCVMCVLLHQYVLIVSDGALTKWILTAPRGGGFFADNREGLLGILPLTWYVHPPSPLRLIMTKAPPTSPPPKSVLDSRGDLTPRVLGEDHWVAAKDC